MTAEALTVIDAYGETETIAWGDVEAVVAYKANLVRGIEVYIELRFQNEFVLLPESHPSFDRVRAEIESQFRIPPEWIETLFDPEFTEKSITLWDQPKMELRKVR